MTIKRIICDSWDKETDDVRWEDGRHTLGYGYQNRETQKIALLRCPICNSYNYLENVSYGQCAWCPFNANNNNYREAKKWLKRSQKTK